MPTYTHWNTPSSIHLPLQSSNSSSTHTLRQGFEVYIVNLLISLLTSLDPYHSTLLIHSHSSRLFHTLLHQPSHHYLLSPLIRPTTHIHNEVVDRMRITHLPWSLLHTVIHFNIAQFSLKTHTIPVTRVSRRTPRY